MTLNSNLASLENAGLIRLFTTHPEVAYIFRHTLARDAAYSALLRPQRRALHRAAGEALEATTNNAAQRAELAPLLAHHFAEAGDDARALAYFKLAGEAAAAQYALPEAIGFFTKALSLARAQPRADSALLVALYIARGHALRSAERWDEALQNFTDLEAEAQARGDEAMRMHSLTEQATLAAVMGPLHDPQRAQAFARQALALAERLGDRPAQARILWNLMRATANFDPHEAIRLGQQSLALAREYGLREQLAYTLHDLLYAYRGAGRPLEALAMLAEARPMWRALGQQHMLADNLTQAASMLFVQGRLAEAEALSREAGQIATATHNPGMRMFGHFMLALVELDRANAALALDELARADVAGADTFASDVVAVIRGVAWLRLGAFASARDASHAAGAHLIHAPMWHVFAQNVLGLRARASLALGDLAAADHAIAEANQLTDFQARSVYLSSGTSDLLYLAEVELALARGQAAAALEVCDRYLAILGEQALSGLRPEALLLRAAALEAAGEPGVAYEALHAAHALATEIGQRRTLWQIAARLATHEAQRGQPEAAAQWRARAAGLAAYVADHAPAELRASFLALPSVQAVLHST